MTGAEVSEIEDIAEVLDRRHPREPARAWHYFRTYRDLGVLRSLTKAADALGLAKKTLEPLSARWRWTERARAWDERVDLEMRAELIDTAREARRLDIRVGRQMTDIAVRRLVGDPDAGVEALDPNELKAADVARLALDGQKIVRLALGEPDAIVQHQGPDAGPIRVNAAVTSDLQAIQNMQVLEDAGLQLPGSTALLAHSLGIALPDTPPPAEPE